MSDGWYNNGDCAVFITLSSVLTRVPCLGQVWYLQIFYTWYVFKISKTRNTYINLIEYAIPHQILFWISVWHILDFFLNYFWIHSRIFFGFLFLKTYPSYALACVSRPFAWVTRPECPKGATDEVGVQRLPRLPVM